MALSKEVKLDIALALYAIIKSLQAEVSHTERHKISCGHMKPCFQELHHKGL